MARVLLSLANQYCAGRIGFLLEGGYDLSGLRDSVAAVLAEMQNPLPTTIETLSQAESGVEPLLGKLLQVHEKYR